MDDERLYTVDNSAIVGAFDLKTGTQLWDAELGTLQKGSPVLADGKLYVGTENGKFYILQPSATGRRGARRGRARHAPSRPRRSSRRRSSPTAACMSRRWTPSTRSASGVPATARNRSGGRDRRDPRRRSPHVAGVPVRVAARARRQADLHACAVRCQGQTSFARSRRRAATWTRRSAGGHGRCRRHLRRRRRQLGRLRQGDGRRRDRAGARARDRAAAVDASTSRTRAPKRRPSWWVGAPAKVFQRTVEGVGNVLVRPRDDTVGRRAKVLMGPADWSGYTIEADVRGTRAAAPARRRRPHQPALRAGALRQRPEARAASVAGRRRDDRARAVQVGREHVVSHEAARRQPARRHDAGARQGVADRRARSRRRGRSRRSTRSPIARAARASTATGSRTCISTM